MPAVAELDQALLVEPHHRDSAPLRLLDQSPGRRAERRPAHRALQGVEPAAEVEAAFHRLDPVEPADAPEVVGKERIDQLERDPPGHQPDLLLVIGEHDVVDARPVLDRAGLAAGGARAGQGLELERDMLGDMAEPGAVAEPLLEAAADLQGAAVAADARQNR